MTAEPGSYWDGATWVYRATITNDGSNSGNHIYNISPGEGNEMEFLYGTVLNGDTATRTIHIEIDDGSDDQVMVNYTISTAAGIRAHVFPTVANENRPNMTRYILSGPMRLRLSVLALATSENSEIGIACRIRGNVPTVTLTSPTDAVEVVSTNRVM